MISVQIRRCIKNGGLHGNIGKGLERVWAFTG